MRAEIVKNRGYDPQIQGTEMSIKIASYPVSVQYLARRLRGKGTSVCELCCGIGISLIELSMVFNKVIGVDNDESVTADCKANIIKAGRNNIEVLNGDVSDRRLLEKIKADIVLYDIPYWSNHKGSVDPAKQNPDLKKLISNIRELINANIVIYAPPSYTRDYAASIAGECELVEVFINNRHDRNFIFTGDLIENEQTKKLFLNN